MRADADYMRQYRRDNPDRRDLERRRQRAHHRALTALAAAYPRPFRRLLNQERAALGLPPVGTVKPGPKRKDDAA